MMNLSEFLLLKVAEEAAEIGQMAAKTIQFTPEEVNHLAPDGPDNRTRLVSELNDLMGVLRLAVAKGLIPADWQSGHDQASKVVKVLKYALMCKKLGTLDPDADLATPTDAIAELLEPMPQTDEQALWLIHAELIRFGEVKWDRWTGVLTGTVTVFGWIHRGDGRTDDFMLIRFEAGLVTGFQTSSARLSAEFAERLDCDHGPCRRVEETWHTNAAVRICRPTFTEPPML